MAQGTIARLAHDAAHRFGERVALTMPGGIQLSFAEIDRLAARFAGGLCALGMVPGDRLVLHLPNGRDWIVAYHAAARLGVVAVPANILLSEDELAYIIDDTGARMVVAPAERAAFLTATKGLTVIVTGDAPAGTTPFDRVLGGAPVPPLDVAADDLFTIGYTSGTTGRPKGAMLTHGNVFASLALTATMHVRHAGDVVLSALPFSHVYGNIVMNAAFLCGYRLVAPPRFDPDDVLRCIGQERVTLFEGVPTMYYQLLGSAQLATADLHSLTRCTVGGQTMPVAMLDRIVARFGCPVLELWGMTEVGGPAITHSPYWSPRHGAIGLPAPGVETRLASLDDPAAAVQPGAIGELQVRGPVVMAGYWRNDAATREAIDPDGWLATGDIARADPDGHLFIVDRKKDIVITGGYNVYPAELEQVIAVLPQVSMVAVAGMPDDEKGEIVCAVIVRAAGATLTAGEVVAHCRRHLAAYKTPRRVAFVDDLPRTSTGKIMKRALAPLLAPCTRVEEEVVR